MTSRHPPSRPASPPYARRPSVSTHQPPPSTPSFAAYPQPISRPADTVARDFPRDAPKGPKALINSSTLPASASASTTSSQHSPHKATFFPPAPQHNASHSHYATPGPGAPPAPRGPGSVGGSSYTPSGPRGVGAGRGGPGILSAGTGRSPVTAAPGGSGSLATSGAFSGYVPEGDRYRGRRQSDWGDSSRGGRGRSRDRDYPDYNSSRGSIDHGRGGFGPRFHDRDRDFDRDRGFREGRGGYYGRQRSLSRERDRGPPFHGIGRGDRDRPQERGFGFVGDRRPDRERERERELREHRERDRIERERAERERERERDREKEAQRERRFAAPTAVPPPRTTNDAPRDSRERPAERPRAPETREFPGTPETSQADRDREKRERDAAE
jgi:hypothetical protein